MTGSAHVAVIYRVDDRSGMVTVVDVAHRRDVYRT